MCGAVRYEITTNPTRVYACHCTDCQRATTSAFSISVSVPAEAFRVSGKELRPVPGGVTDAGRTKTRWVCPDCGICLCGGVKLGTEPRGYIRNVRAGTLDDTSWLRPTIHYYVRSKHPWLVLPENSTIFETSLNRT